MLDWWRASEVHLIGGTYCCQYQHLLRWSILVVHVVHVFMVRVHRTPATLRLRSLVYLYGRFHVYGCAGSLQAGIGQQSAFQISSCDMFLVYRYENSTCWSTCQAVVQ
jgi:hypothetical protein